MPKVVTVKVEGLRELGERMRRLSSDVALKGARSATAAAATPIKKRAKEIIQANPSVDTRRLLNAVIVKRLGKNDDTDGATSMHVVTVRGRGKKSRKKDKQPATAPHAHFVEFGTVNMPAEPFLRPAFEQEKGHAVEVMASQLRKFIDKAGKS
jgi:HK97 gp10 family phage protein